MRGLVSVCWVTGECGVGTERLLGSSQREGRVGPWRDLELRQGRERQGPEREREGKKSRAGPVFYLVSIPFFWAVIPDHRFIHSLIPVCLSGAGVTETKARSLSSEVTVE